MKHSLKITLLLVALFFLAQVIGLYIINHYVTRDLPFNIEKPSFDEKFSFLQIFAIIVVTTIIAMIIIKLKIISLWKFWFFISVWFCLMLALGAFFNQGLSLIISLILAYFKIKRNIIIHNLTEIFIYGGLASIFVSS
ncbi:hypothetical protein HYT58_02715, partial [Candidatus Woesearchaeota archaeon]|nr:hypothetical protein [Candidatus Woesearchaeota archaeon]